MRCAFTNSNEMPLTRLTLARINLLSKFLPFTLTNAVNDSSNLSFIIDNHLRIALCFLATGTDSIVCSRKQRPSWQTRKFYRSQTLYTSKSSNFFNRSVKACPRLRHFPPNAKSTQEKKRKLVDWDTSRELLLTADTRRCRAL